MIDYFTFRTYKINHTTEGAKFAHRYQYEGYFIVLRFGRYIVAASKSSGENKLLT